MPSLEDVTRGSVDLGRWSPSGRSDFRSPRAGSAIWFARRNGQLWMYRSQGATVLRQIQRHLGVRQDGRWGPITSRALRAEAAHAHLPTSGILDGQVTLGMLEFALARTWNLAPGAVSLDPRTALPWWMTDPARDDANHGRVWSGAYPLSDRLPVGARDVADRHNVYISPVIHAAGLLATGRDASLPRDPEITMPPEAQLPAAPAPLPCPPGVPSALLVAGGIAAIALVAVLFVGED